MEKETRKPYPIGVLPYWIHQERRYNDIKSAIERYIEAGIIVPKEWLAEFQTLEGWMNGLIKDDFTKKCKKSFESARERLENGDLKYQDFDDYATKHGW